MLSFPFSFFLFLNFIWTRAVLYSYDLLWSLFFLTNWSILRQWESLSDGVFVVCVCVLLRYTIKKEKQTLYPLTQFSHLWVLPWFLVKQDDIPGSPQTPQAYLQTYVQGVVRTDEKPVQVQGQTQYWCLLFSTPRRAMSGSGGRRLLGYRSWPFFNYLTFNGV